MKMVHTPQGEVWLHEPQVEMLRAIRAFLPFGAVRYSSPQNGADYGLVMQCGEREVYGVKQQPVDCDEAQSRVSFKAHSLLIAHSLAGYRTFGFSGLFMPCPYLRSKDGGRHESGIAYFGCPSDRGHESQEYPYESAFDGSFGHGFTTLMRSFIKALQQSSHDMAITLGRPVGLDIRSRLQMGSVGFGFMVLGQHIICLKTHVSEQDPVWTVLRSTGISDVYHLPSQPIAIREEDLHLAKPEAS